MGLQESSSGIQTRHELDADLRPVRREFVFSDGRVESLRTWMYDDQGRVVEATRVWPGGAEPDERRETWPYDAQGQLVEYTHERSGREGTFRTEYTWSEDGAWGRSVTDRDGDGVTDSKSWYEDGRRIRSVSNGHVDTWHWEDTPTGYIQRFDHGDDGVIDQEIARSFDEQGRLVEHYEHGVEQGKHSTWWYDWSPEGHLMAAGLNEHGRRGHRTESIEQYERDERGLPLTLTRTYDSDGDGTIDERRESWWTWDCP